MKRMVMVCMVLLLMAGVAYATPVVNGGFDSDLSGWDTTQGVTWDSSLYAAKLQIQPFAENIMTITLSQALTITFPATISFDVKFDNGAVRDLGLDESGSPIAVGQPNFFQASFISSIGADFDRVFIGNDVAGPYAPNLVTLPGTSQDGWYRFTGDITGNGMLYLELYDRGDAFYSTAWIDNVVLTENVAPVPEPSTMILLGAGIAGLAFIRRRKV